MTPDEFIEEANMVIENTYDVPSRGQGFAESVREKLESMVETVERTDTVTLGQIRAMRNMGAGVEKWL